MANETEFSNFQTVAAFLAANAAPHFRSAAVTRPLITVEEIPAGSLTKKFVTRGSHTASVTSESASATKSEYTETSVSLTAQKATVYVELSLEADRYAGGTADLTAQAQEAGDALAEKYDTDVLALASGFSQSVGSAGADMSPGSFAQAAYTARLSKSTAPLAAVLHPTQIWHIQEDIAAASAVIYGAREQSNVITQQPSDGGFRGSLFDVPIYESTNVATNGSGTAYIGMVANRYAIASLLDPELVVLRGENVQAALMQLNVVMFYNVVEWKDACGVGLVSSVTA